MAETELGSAREDRPEPLRDSVEAVLVARLAMLDLAAALDVDNIGQTKWALLRASDALAATLMRHGLAQVEPEKPETDGQLDHLA